MLSYDLGRYGWDVEVLTAGPEFHLTSSIEPRSAALRPAGVTVHVATPWAGWFFRLLGSRSVGWRALVPLYRLGARLLARRRFDVIYISTASFPLFCLGRLWLLRFGVSYVLDFHDPWYRPGSASAHVAPSIRTWLSRSSARHLERWSLVRGAGVVAVSSGYLSELRQRYPDIACLRAARSAVIPFGATARDFDAARAAGAGGRPGDEITIAYVGAGSSIMAKSFTRISRSLRGVRELESGLADRVRIRLFGTDGGWREGLPRTLQEIAVREGVGDLVFEQPARIGYLEALGRILNADGVLVLGIDDTAYMPSKLFTYALTGKPLLACLHRESQANRYFQEIPGLGYLLHFGEEDAVEIESAVQTMERFLVEVANRVTHDRCKYLVEYLSPAGARRHADLFDACLEGD
ncbi:MAG: glycosyltransferase [Burkholderiales bacterium]|nr:glycosyltransferase [Burkholderiales bacterium]